MRSPITSLLSAGRSNSIFSCITADPSQIEEQDYRFKYVFRGPQRARNKKLFFVTGRGLKGKSKYKVLILSVMLFGEVQP